MMLGVLFTFFKSLSMPLMIVIYGEFTTLLVDRTYGEGTSSSTYLLHFFGGGRVLYVHWLCQRRNRCARSQFSECNKSHYYICSFTHTHTNNNDRTNATWEVNRREIVNDSIAYGMLMSFTAIVQLVAGIFSVDLFNHAALKQITRIRMKYFQSLMRQDIGWYDTATGNNFAVRITE